MRIKVRSFNFAILPFIFIQFLSTISFGQEELPKEMMAEYEGEIKQMVSFLEFTLNALGDPTISAKEKDVIVNESYLKIFRDEKVQIEDDLIENRDVVTNKDVQAYLKDVDFFFKQVEFDFNILDVAYDLNHEGNLFFTVKLMRNLKGTTVENTQVDADMERYIEVNVDEENKDFRIASIYTTKLSRDQELTIWWAGLSPEWKTLFGLDIEVKDGLRLNEIQEFSDTTYWSDDILFTDSIRIIDYVKEAANKEEINLSGSDIFTSLKPLSQLKNLKKLDISSSTIIDLFPIRNLTTLEYLDCSNTMVGDLQPLKYSKSLRELYVSNTPVISVRVVENFENLEKLHIEHTVIDSLPAAVKLDHLLELNCASTNLERLDSIKNLVSLITLDLSNTAVDNLEPISALKNLENLALNHTNVKSLSPLSGLTNLKELYIQHTGISSLLELAELENLDYIYADNSNIDISEFAEFAMVNPNVTVIFITSEIVEFWTNLDEDWKELFSNKLNFDDSVSAEDLHTLLKIKRLDLKSNSSITDLRPIKYMPLLEELNFSETKIFDLSPIGNTKNLRIINGASSLVLDLSPLKILDKLEVVNFNDTEVNDISPLENLTNLDSLFFNHTKVNDVNVLNTIGDFNIAYFDQSLVGDDDMQNLNFTGNSSIVIYKSEKLRTWWGNMDDHWQNIFREMGDLPSRPSTEQLHKIASKNSLEVSSTSLRNLDPIPEMVRLKTLSFTDTRINSLYPLVSLKSLKELRCPRNPISDVEALSSLNELEVLDLDNTQIKDLKPIRGLTKLRELKFSGTNVKDISPLENLVNLEILEFSKTRVKQINEIYDLNNLKSIKCYNNKISTKRIEEFKSSHPECEVVYY